MRFALGMGTLMSLGLIQAQETKAIDVQVVKYAGLKETVLKNRGKVVVVDFWSTTCIPCIKNFPHLMQLREKFGPDGLVVISVSLDKAEKKGRVLERLRDFKANVTNLILDEPQALVAEKLRIVQIPSVYVFNRQGHWVHFSSDEGDGVSPEAVEKLVRQWLGEK